MYWSQLFPIRILSSPEVFLFHLINYDLGQQQRSTNCILNIKSSKRILSSNVLSTANIRYDVSSYYYLLKIFFSTQQKCPFYILNYSDLELWRSASNSLLEVLAVKFLFHFHNCELKLWYFFFFFSV